MQIIPWYIWTVMWHSTRCVARALAYSVRQELFTWVSGLPEHEGDGLTSISCGDFGLSRWMLLHFGIWSRVVLTDGHISEKIAAAIFRRRFFKLEAAGSSETFVHVYQTTWWTMWHWHGFSTECFGFPLPISFHQCSILIFQRIQLSTTEAVWSWKPTASFNRTLLYLFPYFASLLGFFADESRCRNLVEDLLSLKIQ